MSVEIAVAWNEYMKSLPEDDVDTLIDDNNRLTDAVLHCFGDIVDEYQLFIESRGVITAPYPCNKGRGCLNNGRD